MHYADYVTPKVRFDHFTPLGWYTELDDTQSQRRPLPRWCMSFPPAFPQTFCPVDRSEGPTPSTDMEPCPFRGTDVHDVF